MWKKYQIPIVAAAIVMALLLLGTCTSITDKQSSYNKDVHSYYNPGD